MPLFSPQVLTFSIIGLAVLVLILLGLLIRMHIKLRRFLVGVEAENIGDSLASISADLQVLQAFKAELELYLEQVEKRLRKSVQSVHTVRFNPFKGTGGGGNQSFAAALLTEEGNGVIFSSLYSRDHVSVFAKPVKTRSSEHELSDEEREALEYALKGLEIRQ